MLAAFFISKTLGIAYALMWILFLVSLLIGLPKQAFTKELLYAILKLPTTSLAMFGSIVGIKGSNKSFIHTTHSKTEVTNPLFKKYNG